tara:strand:- start:2527 stop:3468 length:942 start_codon:yes stop_codon:yes gene_type:complete
MAGESTFRPRVLKGLIFGILLSGWSVCLTVGLAFVASEFSFGALKVLVYGCSFFAALLTLFFSYWILCFLKLRYTVNDDNLIIHWGLVRHIIPLASVTRISTTGYSNDIVINMFSWPGMSIGKGFSRLDLTTSAPKPISIFSTSRNRQELLYLETPSSLYGLSVSDEADFLGGIGAYGHHDSQELIEPHLGYIWPRLHFLISSATVWVYLILIIAMTILMWSEFSFRYAGLPVQLEGVFPISQEKSRFVTLWLREELFQIPLIASLLVVGNTILGLIFFMWEQKLALMVLFSAILIPALAVFLFELTIHVASG